MVHLHTGVNFFPLRFEISELVRQQTCGLVVTDSQTAMQVRM